MDKSRANRVEHDKKENRFNSPSSYLFSKYLCPWFNDWIQSIYKAKF